jgi:hypothetical protein
MTWAAAAVDLETIRRRAVDAGVPLGDIVNGGRVRPDGVALSWQFTNPRAVVADGIVPFLIDWGASPHPSAQAAAGLSLVSLHAEHPSPDTVSAMLHAIGVALPVHGAATPALIATIDGPRGRVELR